ncbi:hypothetical protein [Phenylobacterium sp.]|jgi:hypothetical protein|uniref:hypothetical protein n=1 Tax=Phenylobacterium sp. TaxID=1871053 RepID=UPI002F945147
MFGKSQKRFLSGAAVAALALSVVGGAVAQNREADVRLSRDLVAAASAFETFMGKAGAIDAKFDNAKEVADAVKVGAAHDASQLQAGMVAYAALAALQEPSFVSGVERAARYEGRDALAQQLLERPDLAAALPGAEPAAARAAGALAAKSEPLTADGRRVKQAAYDVQRQAWSKVRVPQPASRLANAKQLSATRFRPTDDDAARLYRAVSSRPTASPRGYMSPVVARGLALAALSLLDAAGEENSQALQQVVNDAGSASCLRMAKLNLFQCLAVAGPHYEDIFCLGEHAMIEPGQCVSKAAGLAVTPTRYSER